MAEVFAFPEGSAFLGTGNASALGLFVGQITVTIRRERHAYRPPYAVRNSYVELRRSGAAFSLTQQHSQAQWQKLLANSTGGALWGHVFSLNPGTNDSAGVWLYTGTLNDLAFRQSDGAAGELTLQADFEVWSAYP